MARSLLILVATIVVVIASYYGFRHLEASGERTNASPALLTSTTKGRERKPDAAAEPSPASASAASVNASSRAGPAEGAPAGSRPAGGPDGASKDPVPPAGATPDAFHITISNAHPPLPSDVIRVNKDDSVTLAITSDRPGHVEVHGYRKEATVEPGKTATLAFKASRTGRFPIDLHGSDGAHVEVTALEVMPR